MTEPIDEKTEKLAKCILCGRICDLGSEKMKFTCSLRHGGKPCMFKPMETFTRESLDEVRARFKEECSDIIEIAANIMKSTALTEDGKKQTYLLMVEPFWRVWLKAKGFKGDEPFVEG